MAEIEVKSEITGAVWKILVKPGDDVDEDDPLVILESMKMEIPITAPESGQVSRIVLAEGDPVAEGQLVAVLAV